MTISPLVLTVTAVITLTMLAVFGGYKYASAHSGSPRWHGGMHKLHDLKSKDWDDPEKVQRYRDMCVSLGMEKFELMTNHVESELQLREEQSGAWDDLRATLQAEKETMRFVCDKILNRENIANLPSRLELISTLMATGQESLQRVTPAINAFYAVLDDKQKQRVEDMIRSHHKGHGMFH